MFPSNAKRRKEKMNSAEEIQKEDRPNNTQCLIHKHDGPTNILKWMSEYFFEICQPDFCTAFFQRFRWR